MEIYIPSKSQPFTLEVVVTTARPEKIRIIAKDITRERTYLLGRKSTVRGKRTFTLKFPVTPTEMKVFVFNAENGNLPLGEDKSFSIEHVEAKAIKHRDLLQNSDVKEFIDFAEEFTLDAMNKKAGGRVPVTYKSRSGKYTIDYYDVIHDHKTGKALGTPARIGHKTGTIEVSKKKFANYTQQMMMLILLHEFSHKYQNPKRGRRIDDEVAADVHALHIYLGRGYSEFEAHKTFLYVFEYAKSKENHRRYKVIKDFIERYTNGEIKRSTH